MIPPSCYGTVMPNDELPREQEFNPEGAFLYAFEEAIEITADCLRAVGADEATIWEAFRNSIKFLIESTHEVDRLRHEKSQDSLPGRRDYLTLCQLAHRRRQAPPKAAST